MHEFHGCSNFQVFFPTSSSLVFESLALKIQQFTGNTSWIQFTMTIFRSCEV